MHKTLLKLICVFVVSIIVCIFCVQSSNYKSYVVPGTVFSKIQNNMRMTNTIEK